MMVDLVTAAKCDIFASITVTSLNCTEMPFFFLHHNINEHVLYQSATVFYFFVNVYSV